MRVAKPSWLDRWVRISIPDASKKPSPLGVRGESKTIAIFKIQIAKLQFKIQNSSIWKVNRNNFKFFSLNFQSPLPWRERVG
jgi:hypothetical protein